MYTQAKAVQRLHRKYLYEEISIEKAYEIFMTLWARDLVEKMREVILETDPVWLDNIGKIVKEWEEEEKRMKGKLETEEGQLFLPFNS